MPTANPDTLRRRRLGLFGPGPALVVCPDFGMAPYLWRGDGGGPLADGAYRYGNELMSVALWEAFAPWACAFESCPSGRESPGFAEWDWPVFHRQGLALTHQLKAEVGDAWRVFYEKPCEDPNHGLDACVRVEADGSTVPVPRHSGAPPWMVVSGGQTGVDRAALDFAIDYRIPHGGYCPAGRLAHDGPIPRGYQLHEIDGGYRQRTRRNVEHSDGTLLLCFGEPVGGTALTLRFVERLQRHHQVVDLGERRPSQVHDTLAWLAMARIRRLNVAGPSERRHPGAHAAAYAFLAALHAGMA